MALESIVARINLFGLTWGTIVNVALTFGGGLSYHAERNGFILTEHYVSDFLFGELFYSCWGVLLAVPFALSLGFYETKRQVTGLRFVATSISLCAVCCLPVWVWLQDNPIITLGGLGTYNGAFWVDLAAYVAALVASYVVARCLPFEVYPDKKPLASMVLIVEMLLIAAILLPTFQKVRGIQTASAAGDAPRAMKLSKQL